MNRGQLREMIYDSLFNHFRLNEASGDIHHDYLDTIDNILDNPFDNKITKLLKDLGIDLEEMGKNTKAADKLKDVEKKIADKEKVFLKKELEDKLKELNKDELEAVSKTAKKAAKHKQNFDKHQSQKQKGKDFVKNLKDKGDLKKSTKVSKARKKKVDTDMKGIEKKMKTLGQLTDKDGNVMKVKNPKTGKMIQATSALKKGHPAYKIAVAKLRKRMKSMNEASDVWKRFDAMQTLQGDAMDIEMDMKNILATIKQLHKNMEQEAEPEGGKIADKYGKQLDKYEKMYKKRKAELKKVFAKLDKLEQF